MSVDPAADDVVLLQTLNKCLLELSKTETRNQLLSMPAKCPQEQINSSNNQTFASAVQDLVEHAKTMCPKVKSVPLAKDWQIRAHYMIKACNMILNLEDFSNFSKVSINVSNLSYFMNEVLKELPEAKKFTPCNDDYQSYKAEALKQYVKNAELIISEPEYEGSSFDRIESLLVNMQSEINDEFSAPSNPSLATTTSKSFISIVSPMMEGKTQLAFVLRRVKPIYFILSEVDRGTLQIINEKFLEQAFELQRSAEEDLRIIAAKMNTKVSRDMDLSPDLLKNLSSYIPLWTVGYLMELVNCKEPYKRDESWMEYYARRSEFEYYPARIDDIPEGYFSEFCMYLDGWYTKNWTVYVRNLARAIGIKTICTGRSTGVIGKVRNERRKAEDHSVWSVVAVKLNPPSLSVLNTNHDLEDTIKSIKSAALGNVSGLSKRQIMAREQKNPICYFLNDFMKNQLKHMQPGIVILVAKILKDEVKVAQSTAPINLGTMLNLISRKLSRKKPIFFNISSTPAFFSKAGLLLPEAYAKDPTVSILNEGDAIEKKIAVYKDSVKKREPFFNRRQNTDFHLYYLNNPRSPDNLFFLTFAPEEDVMSRSLMTLNYDNKLVTWKYKYTYFEASNILTFLACLNLKCGNGGDTVAMVYDKAIKCSTFQFTPVKKRKSDSSKKVSKNPLEMLWALTVVLSSMRVLNAEGYARRDRNCYNSSEFDYLAISVGGQKGTSFIKCLVHSLIPEVGPNGTSSHIDISFFKSTKFDLKSEFLDRSLIPFLYSIDRSIPLLDKFSAPNNNNGIYARPYETIGDSEQLDGRFEFMFNGQVKYVEVICKYQKDGISTAKLKNILTKSMKSNDNTILSLIRCKRITDKATLTTACYKYCKRHEINVFHVDTPKYGKYKVYPLFKDKGGLFPDPKLVCIVFESDAFYNNLEQPCLIQ